MRHMLAWRFLKLLQSARIFTGLVGSAQISGRLASDSSILIHLTQLAPLQPLRLQLPALDVLDRDYGWAVQRWCVEYERRSMTKLKSCSVLMLIGRHALHWRGVRTIMICCVDITKVTLLTH